MTSGHRILDNRETVHEDVPAVDDFEAKRDLVLALQIALSVRITKTDQLHGKFTLNTPTHTILEVTQNGANLRISRLRDTRNSITLSDRYTREVGDVGAETELRVSHLRRFAAAVARLEVCESPSELRINGRTIDAPRIIRINK